MVRVWMVPEWTPFCNLLSIHDAKANLLLWSIVASIEFGCQVFGLMPIFVLWLYMLVASSWRAMWIPHVDIGQCNIDDIWCNANVILFEYSVQCPMWYERHSVSTMPMSLFLQYCASTIGWICLRWIVSWPVCRLCLMLIQHQYKYRRCRLPCRVKCDLMARWVCIWCAWSDKFVVSMSLHDRDNWLIVISLDE